MARRAFVSTMVAVVVVAGIVAAPALAFRPSATWLFNRVLERARERGTTSLRVESTTSTWDATGTAVVAGDAERTWIATGGRVRRELDNDKGMTAEIRADGKLLTRVTGQADKTSKAGIDVLAEVMTVSSSQDETPAAQRLIAQLKGLGINTEVTSYSRFDGRVAYIVGSKPWETDKAQVWFDKDLLVPLRLVTFQKEGSATVKVDTRWLGWGSPVGGSWYPQAVEVWRADKLVRRTVTEDLERNITVDTALFAIP